LANPAFVRITYQKQILEGPLTFGDTCSLWQVLQFSHEVGDGKYVYNGWKPQWEYNHKPMTFVLELGNFAPALYRAFFRDEIIDKIELFWPRHSEKSRKSEIYFIIALYPVKLNSVRQYFPNVKDRAFENYGHLMELTFRYRWIEWEYTKGKLWIKKEWIEFILDGYDYRTEKERREFLELLARPAITDDMVITKREISIVSAGWEHLDKELKEASPQAAAEKNRIRLFADVTGAYEDEFIRFELYSFKEKSAGIHIASVSGKIKEGKGSAEWEVDLSKIKEKDCRLKCEPVVNGKYGAKCEINLVKKKRIMVPWFIDCHMHIQSTSCAPGPLTAGTAANYSLVEMLEIITSAPGFSGTPGLFSQKTTLQIGTTAVTKSGEVLEDKDFEDGMGGPSKRRRLLVALTMDMDFGHWRGYEGKKMYDEVNGKYVQYKNADTLPKPLSRRKYDKSTTFKNQIKETQNAFLKSKGNLLSFFCYDPRRWQLKRFNPKAFSGRWDDPFGFLVQTGDLASAKTYMAGANALEGSSLQNEIGFFTAIGFKMYTALGFRPDDFERLPHLMNYYANCVTHNIPIICHGSRGGMLTHDWLRYRRLCGPLIVNSKNVETDDIPPCCIEDRDFFWENYISPYAWEQVLQRFPNLRLCLAHFGGVESWSTPPVRPDWLGKLIEMMRLYPNFYVDLSYVIFQDSIKSRFTEIIEDPLVRKKLLFGTDWYLINLEWAKLGFGSTYDHFFRKLYRTLQDKRINEIDPYILARLNVLNHLKFLNLIIEEVITKILSLVIFVHKIIIFLEPSYSALSCASVPFGFTYPNTVSSAVSIIIRLRFSEVSTVGLIILSGKTLTINKRLLI